MLPGGSACLPGVHASQGGCLLPGGVCSSWGVRASQGVHASQGGCVLPGGGCMLPRGVVVSQHAPPPPVNRITHE